MSWIPCPLLTWNPIDRPPNVPAFYQLRYASGQVVVRYHVDGQWFVDRPTSQFRQIVDTSNCDCWRELLEQPA